MNMRGKYLFICFIVFFLFSCDNNNRREAEKLLSRIEHSFEIGNHNMAKIQIDSLHVMFRKHVDLRKKADNFLSKIEKINLERNLSFFTDLLLQKQLQLDSLANYFILEKDSKIQVANRFVHKKLRQTNTSAFLRPYVALNGDLSLISIYSGMECDYDSITLLNKDYFVQSETAVRGQTHSFRSRGRYWRTMLLSEEESEKIAHFITLYPDNDLRVLLQGNSCKYSYILPKKYRKAIIEAHYLSLYIRSINELKRNIEETENKLNELNQ